MLRKYLSLVLLATLVLSGCGGGGSSTKNPAAPAATGQGRATVSIVWPERAARFVPISSNAIEVKLSLGGAVVATQSAARPATGNASTLSFDRLAYGTYDVAIATYPNADATGAAQARGTAQMTVTEDTPGTADVSLATTVASLAILPVAFDKRQAADVSVTATVASLAILPVAFDKRQAADVSVTATDANGATVLLQVGANGETVTWSIDPVVNTLGQSVPAATLSGAGPTVSLMGLHSGTTTIRATVALGLSTPLTATGAVTVNAIADGTATVTVR